MFKKILVPIDGSKISEYSLSVAKKVGEKFQADVLVLSVISDLRFSSYYPDADATSRRLLDVQRNQTIFLLEEAEKTMSDYPFHFSTHYVIGSPGREILKFAEEQNTNLIIMGNRGLGAFSRTFLGSVSQVVMNHSKASVLVVKEDELED